MLWLSEADVEALVDPPALVEAVRQGFLAAAAGGILEPPSTRLDGLDGGGSYLTVFPAHHPAARFASAKVLAGRPANAAAGRPEIDAVVALVDSSQARIVALLAGRALTALRTAAVTTLAIERLAGRGLAIGLVGTGAQARAHARLLGETGVAAAFRVASPLRGEARAAAFAREIEGMAPAGAEPRTVSSVAAGCDAVVTVSLARRPMPLGALPDTVLLAGVGPFYPEAHEFDPRLLARAGLIVSDMPDRLRRQWAGSPLIDLDALAILSMADLAGGRIAAPADGLRIVLSDGRGFQDNVAATLIYRAAVAEGRGLRLP